MIIDDDPLIRETLGDLFREKGYGIDTAGTGKSAIDKARKTAYNVALIDLKLPDMGGIELLRKLKKAYPDIVCIIATGNATLQNAVDALGDGASGYFVKPLVIDEVIHRVDEALEKQGLQRELSESLSRYQGLVETSTDAIVSSNSEGKIIQWNEAASRIFGYSDGEIIGKQIGVLIPEKYLNAHNGCIQKFLGNNKQSLVGKTAEMEGICKDGSIVPIELSLSTLEATGSPVFTAIIRDITDRKNAEAEIKELIKFNEKILRELQEGVIVGDTEGRITFANPRMAEMLGYEKDEISGRPWSRFIATDYQRKVGKETAKNLAGEKSKYEAVLISKDGKETSVIISATPMYEEGAISGLLSVITDISGLKAADDTAMQKMMKYRVDRGNVYLVQETEPEKSKSVLLDLLECGFDGLVISRTPPTKVKDAFDVDVPVIWLSEKRYDSMTTPPNFLLIEKTIENYLDRNRVVLLDRLDYLILKNGFSETLEFVQKLSELFFINKGILILSVDPGILDERQLRILAKEVLEVKLKHEPDFPEDLYEILEFVYEQNKIGEKPSHKNVEQKFGITQTTARKRINKLRHRELLEDRKLGRFKVLRLTEKARVYFN